MPRFPGADWNPVTRYQSVPLKVPMVRHDAVVGHTAVSPMTPSMHSWFNQSGKATPHFYIGFDGEIEQYIDTDFRSTAVLNGNHRCITFESWDGYPHEWSGGNAPPWTDDQVETIAQLIAWAHQVHGIPLEWMRNSKPTSRGIGWHRLGCDGNYPQAPGELLGGRVAGGETWTGSRGKTCPTDPRIRQYPALIIPRAIEIANGDDDMQLDDKIAKNGPTVQQVLRKLDRYLTKTVPALRAQIASVKAAVAAGATQEELEQMLEGLDVTLQVVVSDDETDTP